MRRLTSIITGLVKTDEHMIDLQFLFCKLQQQGKTEKRKKTIRKVANDKRKVNQYKKKIIWICQTIIVHFVVKFTEVRNTVIQNFNSLLDIPHFPHYRGRHNLWKIQQCTSCKSECVAAPEATWRLPHWMTSQLKNWEYCVIFCSNVNGPVPSYCEYAIVGFSVFGCVFYALQLRLVVDVNVLNVVWLTNLSDCFVLPNEPYKSLKIDQPMMVLLIIRSSL